MIIVVVFICVQIQLLAICYSYIYSTVFITHSLISNINYTELQGQLLPASPPPKKKEKKKKKKNKSGCAPALNTV